MRPGLILLLALALVACAEQEKSTPRAVPTPAPAPAKSAVKPEPPKAAAPDPNGPFRLRGDADIDKDIEAAKVQATNEHKRVLLEFLAEWCEDCQEVVRVSALPPVPDTVASLYVTVPINVGRWDRAKLWRDAYHVKRIATLVVLESSGKRVAQTTLEPITGTSGPLTPEALVAWLKDPKDAPEAESAEPAKDDKAEKKKTETL